MLLKDQSYVASLGKDHDTVGKQGGGVREGGGGSEDDGCGGTESLSSSLWNKEREAVTSPALVICTVDGTVYTLGAVEGELRGLFSSGDGLVQSSSSPLSAQEARMVIPGLDGSLYQLTTTRTTAKSSSRLQEEDVDFEEDESLGDDDTEETEDATVGTKSSEVSMKRNGSFSLRRDQASKLALDMLPMTAMDIVHHATPVVLPKGNGIAMGDRRRVMYALDATTGAVQWMQDSSKQAGGFTTSSSSTSNPLVWLQREDYHVREIHALTGHEHWNVQIGRFSPLGDLTGAAAAASSSSTSRNSRRGPAKGVDGKQAASSRATIRRRQGRAADAASSPSSSLHHQAAAPSFAPQDDSNNCDEGSTTSSSLGRLSSASSQRLLRHAESLLDDPFQIDDNDQEGEEEEEDDKDEPWNVLRNKPFPSVTFGEDGCTIGAVDTMSGQVLWTQPFDSVIAAVYGVDATAGGWVSVNIVDHALVDEKDDQEELKNEVVNAPYSLVKTTTSTPLERSSNILGPATVNTMPHGNEDDLTLPAVNQQISGHWMASKEDIPNEHLSSASSSSVVLLGQHLSSLFVVPTLRSRGDNHSNDQNHNKKPPTLPPLAVLPGRAHEPLHAPPLFLTHSDGGGRAGTLLSSSSSSLLLIAGWTQVLSVATLVLVFCLYLARMRRQGPRAQESLLVFPEGQATAALPEPLPSTIHARASSTGSSTPSLAPSFHAASSDDGGLLLLGNTSQEYDDAETLYETTQGGSLSIGSSEHPSVSTLRKANEEKPNMLDVQDLSGNVASSGQAEEDDEKDEGEEEETSSKGSSNTNTNSNSKGDLSSSNRILDRVTSIDGVPIVQYARYQAEFQELELLGKGGFGAVYRSENVLDGRQYAIKKILMKAQVDADGRVTERFSQKLRRVLREVKNWALLDDPNVVRYYTAWLEVDSDETRDESDVGEGPTSTGLSYVGATNATRTGEVASAARARGVAKGRFSSLWRGPNDDEESSSTTRTPARTNHDHSSTTRSGGASSSSYYGFGKLWQKGAPSRMAAPPKTDLSDVGFVWEKSREASYSASASASKSMDTSQQNRKAAGAATSNALGSTTRHHDSSSLQGTTASESTRKLTRDSAVVPASTQNSNNKSPLRLQRHTLYIQMQLCSHETLANLLEERTRNQKDDNDEIDIPSSLRLFCQVAKGVEHVHGHGLIHRDLKPGNCFIDEHGVLKVGDFGLSREAGTAGKGEEGDDDDDHHHAVDGIVVMAEEGGAATATGEASNTAGVGTRSYASPEQMAGSNYDAKTDVYSLGIMLFELCYPMNTGMERYAVFKGLRKGQLPEKWHQTVARSFPSLHDLLQRMLCLHAAERPTSAEVAQHVEQLVGEYSALSLDRASRESGSLLLRVEAVQEEGILTRTMQLLKEAAPGVEILQYGVRGNDSRAVMEFALTTTCNQVPPKMKEAIMSKLIQNNAIRLAREVSM